MGTVQQAGLSTQHTLLSTYSVAIRQLMAAPEKPPKKIGFQLKEKRAA